MPIGRNLANYKTYVIKPYSAATTTATSSPSSSSSSSFSLSSSSSDESLSSSLSLPLQLQIPGLIGELYVGGTVFQGYLNRSELNQQVLIDAPTICTNSLLYKTGDLVRYNEQMELVFVGRVDFQVKIRGQRLEVGEIESCILSYSYQSQEGKGEGQDKGEGDDDKYLQHLSIQQCVVMKRYSEGEGENKQEYLCAYMTIKRDNGSR